jgi:hypothetical protein
MIKYKNNKAVKTAIGAVLTALLLYFGDCQSQSKLNKNFKTLQLTVNYPIITLNDDNLSFFNITDSIFINYYEDFVLYKLAPSRIFETNEKIPGTETYFVFKKKDKYGLWLSKLDSINHGKSEPVDSFLNIRAFASAKFNLTTNDSLIQSVNDKKANILQEKYIPKKRYGEFTFDSVYYYFTNDLKNFDYSFSPKLDSIRNMKLFKVRLLYNQSFSSKYNHILPKREYFFQIKEVPITNPEKILNFFKKFGNSL